MRGTMKNGVTLVSVMSGRIGSLQELREVEVEKQYLS